MEFMNTENNIDNTDKVDDVETAGRQGIIEDRAIALAPIGAR